ncbi:Hypoxanthine-guanine phosphoribosyltransferase [Zancudomyces culisetae]|uniref:Hypoxanthine phosphoribosyltransferase n=1 Tax=Zancudomyces culisetae TaxID=1213189 RepID=A0A1R1PLS8_ZANCU|nr:Hypoxanthine-guanine phosphoribosyltransferase [Zancudomyces culisetae]|eukprot:OMH81928.1 Hypoxanthine-guanine phosphoribosyltransferase [Zancudomyces culisetae]
MTQKKDWIDVTGDTPKYDLSHFSYPDYYSEDIASILLPNGLILSRIDKLARTIVSRYDKHLVVCCILKGGYQFFSDLSTALKKYALIDGKNITFSEHFVRIQSYNNDQSTGNVRISMSEEQLRDLEGKDVLIVEDLIDTGASMVALSEFLKDYNLKSMSVASLLVKDTVRSNGFTPEYVGFLVPDHFIIGYCIDYNDMFRELNHVCTISEVGKKKYAK